MKITTKSIETTFHKRAIGDAIAIANLSSFPVKPGNHELLISVQLTDCQGDPVATTNVLWALEISEKKKKL